MSYKPDWELTKDSLKICKEDAKYILAEIDYMHDRPEDMHKDLQEFSFRLERMRMNIELSFLYYQTQIKRAELDAK